jgi:hypothetical protein
MAGAKRIGVGVSRWGKFGTPSSRLAAACLQTSDHRRQVTSLVDEIDDHDLVRGWFTCRQ